MDFYSLKCLIYIYFCVISMFVSEKNAYITVLSKFAGPVGQSDISYKCPTNIVRVPDQMSDRKYKNIHLMDEKKRNTSDHKGLRLGSMSSRCFCRHS